jgi:molybdenum cofactor cytidylyltransferase
VIAGIVLAAGKSERMGRPKMALPWGDTTVLGHVIRVLRAAGIDEIMVVAGAARAEVAAICQTERAQTVFNDVWAAGEMLSSIQAGLGAMPSHTAASLIALGDQPQIQAATVSSVVESYVESPAPLVVPSYKMRRGHPWLVDRSLWDELLRLSHTDTAREFLNRHASEIRYVEIDSPTVVQDLDTPEDYLNSRP